MDDDLTPIWVKLIERWDGTPRDKWGRPLSFELDADGLAKLDDKGKPIPLSEDRTKKKWGLSSSSTWARRYMIWVFSAALTPQSTCRKQRIFPGEEYCPEHAWSDAPDTFRLDVSKCTSIPEGTEYSAYETRFVTKCGGRTPHSCGFDMCASSKDSCARTIANQVIAVISAAVSLFTFGAVNFASKVAVQAAKKSIKQASRASTVSHFKLSRYFTREAITEAYRKTVSAGHSVITGLASAAGSVGQSLLLQTPNMIADNMAGFFYSAIKSKEQRQIINVAFDTVSYIDPTGITGLVSTFNYADCGEANTDYIEPSEDELNRMEEPTWVAVVGPDRKEWFGPSECIGRGVDLLDENYRWFNDEECSQLNGIRRHWNGFCKRKAADITVRQGDWSDICFGAPAPTQEHPRKDRTTKEPEYAAVPEGVISVCPF